MKHDINDMLINDNIHKEEIIKNGIYSVKLII